MTVNRGAKTKTLKVTFGLFIVVSHREGLVSSHNKEPVTQACDKIGLVVDWSKHQLVVGSQNVKEFQKACLI